MIQGNGEERKGELEHKNAGYSRTAMLRAQGALALGLQLADLVFHGQVEATLCRRQIV